MRVIRPLMNGAGRRPVEEHILSTARPWKLRPGIGSPAGTSTGRNDGTGFFQGDTTYDFNEVVITQHKTRRNKTMRHTKRLAGFLTAGTLAVLAFLAGFTQEASATAISTNNAAGIVVRITPNVDRGVVISSGDVNLNLGTVDLGASTQTVRPATVTIQGNLTNTELNMDGVITGGWSYDNTQARTSTGTNLLNVWATFTSISTATAPSQDDEYFRVGTSSGAKLISPDGTFGTAAIGLSGSDGFGRFESNGDTADMDVMSPADQRHLWFFFTLPPQTDDFTEQQINFVLSTRGGP